MNMLTNIVAALACSALVLVPTTNESSVTLEASWLDSDTLAISIVDVTNFEVASVTAQLAYDPQDTAVAGWRMYGDFGMWISSLTPKDNPPGEINLCLSIDHESQDPIDDEAAIADIHLHAFSRAFDVSWCDDVLWIFDENGRQPDVINLVGP
jgi:hypothetical protein